MAKREEKVFGTLFELEQSLASFEDKGIADSALADDFVEFGSSGKVYNKKDVLDMYETVRSINHVIADYAIAFLSDTVVKASFRSELNGRKALRTSNWVLADKEWRLRFHQGTIYEAESGDLG